MTLETLLLLQQLLLNQQLQVGSPDFVEAAGRVVVALEELDRAIRELS